MIISSAYIEGVPQVDGRRYVTESHIEESGRVHTFEWLGSQDAQVVLDQRAAILNEQISARDAAVALVIGTTINITKLEFRRRFTLGERQLIDEFNATFESNPILSDEQKRAVRTAQKDFDNALDVSLIDPSTIAGVNLYAALGLVTPDRVVEILGVD